jgi:hypothetical protein
MKTYEKLARFIKLNDYDPQLCFKCHIYTRSQKEISSWRINMDMKAYIIEP